MLCVGRNVATTAVACIDLDQAAVSNITNTKNFGWGCNSPAPTPRAIYRRQRFRASAAERRDRAPAHQGSGNAYEGITPLQCYSGTARPRLVGYHCGRPRETRAPPPLLPIGSGTMSDDDHTPLAELTDANLMSRAADYRILAEGASTEADRDALNRVANGFERMAERRKRRGFGARDEELVVTPQRP